MILKLESNQFVDDNVKKILNPLIFPLFKRENIGLILEEIVLKFHNYFCGKELFNYILQKSIQLLRECLKVKLNGKLFFIINFPRITLPSQ